MPFPISTPIIVPITCAITAPGPNRADNTGMEQMKPKITSPIPLPARGTKSFANQLPNPEPLIIPINIATNAMKGKIVVIMDYTASRAA